MTYPPNQPYPGSDPGQPGGSPYAAGQPSSPYASQPGGQQHPPYLGAAAYGPGYGAGFPPSNNIGWAIAAIFLFWPLAIPAFIASGKVEDCWRRGDVVGAQQASADAKRWGSLGVWIGIGLSVASCALVCVIPAFLGVGVCGLGGLGAIGSEGTGG